MDSYLLNLVRMKRGFRLALVMNLEDSGLKVVEKRVGTVFTAVMRQEGRVTVPKIIRDAYEIEEGDLVECQIKKIR